MRATPFIVATLALTGRTLAAARAAAQGTPGPAGAPAPGAAGGGSSAVVTVVILLAVVVAVIAALVKVLDLRRRREAEAVQLQAQVSDALLRDPRFAGLPLAATAHIGWRGSPATLELSGQVPSEELRAAALRLAREEALRLRSDVTVEDRLTVVPTGVQAA